MVRILAAWILAAALTGCVPLVTRYVQLAAPGVNGVTFAPVCGDHGPPAYAKYERNGVRFTVTLERGWISESQAGYMNVRAPKHVTISIPDPVGYVVRTDKAGGPKVHFELRRTERFENRYTVALLERSGVLEYHLDFVGLPPIAFSGMLTLPVVYADGVAVTSPVFEFEPRPYAGIVPFNC
jgi:hypothetical protein